MTARWLTFWSLAGLLPALAACDDGDAGRSELRCAGSACSADCRELAGPPCDVLTDRCRARVLRAVSCARGGGGQLPQIRIMSEEEYRLELNEPLSADGGLRDGAAPDPDDDAGLAGAEPRPAKLDSWSLALGMLGLLPRGMDLRSSSIESSARGVAGYYESDEQRITLIDRGKPQDDWSAIEVFAHELVHALQDQSLGLSELWTRSAGYGDGAFAHGCLIEGEAQLYTTLALALLRDVAFDDAYFAVLLRAQLKYTRRAVASAPAPYAATWQLRYPIGAGYLFDAYRQDGHWAVQALFEAQPSSAIHWMVGFEQNASRREHLVLPLACDLAAAPAGYRLQQQRSLGAAVLFAFLAHGLRQPDGVLTTEEQWRNALRWRQDSLSVFENGAGQVALSYRVRFDDEALAAQLAEQLAASTIVALQVVQHGDELELLAADDPALLDGWHTDPDACPLPP